MNKQKIISIIAAALLAAPGIYCSKKNLGPGAFLARSEEYYTKLGISKNPLPEEDAMRSTGREGTYEWWYFDSEFDNGTKVVTVFYTKHKFDVPGPAHPTVTIDVTLPDGKSIKKQITEKRGTLLNAARDRCDVKINDSYIKNISGDYEIKFTDADVSFSCRMKRKLPMWRPGTGHWYFGKEAKNYFAWFVAMPSAEINATLTMDGKTAKLRGNGYHDHNWGNVEMHKLFNHWYWSRVVLRDFTVIACDLVSTEEYGYTRLPVFMLAQKGKIINDNEAVTKIIRSETTEHPITKKFIDNTLVFEQKLSDTKICRVSLKRKKDLTVVNLLEHSGLSSIKKLIAGIIGENPTYIRTTGDAELIITDKGRKTELKSEAIWEQMFFGKNKNAIINDFREL